ncbi:50S ribosomal protein L6 [Bifidobacterium catenulatum subsp. kashiwanohense JCM 15439 = DSM 21854]|nr:50S ribosomal protein L6 [Bifidobacterium catenulatum subsp. kashiwanohense JCM 15439 = DSM 21854]
MASHIGKLPVTIPAGVEVKIDGQSFTAKGVKGTDSYEIPEGITAQVEGNEIILVPADDLRPTRAKHGLARSIVASMVKGVHEAMPRPWISLAPVTVLRRRVRVSSSPSVIPTPSPLSRRKASSSNCRTRIR